MDYAYQNNLLMGTGDDKFSPGLSMSRAMMVTVFYRLADYEDTNREPAEIRKLEREYRTAVNELCYMCGKYKQEHEGACHGCRWEKPVR